VDAETSLFGSPTRDRVLVLLEVKKSSHLREIARIFELSVPTAQRAIKQLEFDGLIVARLVGRSRLLELNPRFFAYNELRDLLHAIALKRPDLYAPAEQIRNRPRRSGKPL
jgi:DNA-binding transcriptional ArsR family regulator